MLSRGSSPRAPSPLVHGAPRARLSPFASNPPRWSRVKPRAAATKAACRMRKPTHEQPQERTFPEPGSGGTSTRSQIAPPNPRQRANDVPTDPCGSRRCVRPLSPGRRLPLDLQLLSPIPGTSDEHPVYLQRPPASMPTELCHPSISLEPSPSHPCRALEGGRTCESTLTRTGPARTRDMGPRWATEMPDLSTPTRDMQDPRWAWGVDLTLLWKVGTLAGRGALRGEAQVKCHQEPHSAKSP